jgi:hypothetical protein
LTLALLASTIEAHAAVTQRVKDACRDEYFAYCSAYEVGSEELRRCMDKAQDHFSERCLNELAAAGEASKEQVRAYKARHK